MRNTEEIQQRLEELEFDLKFSQEWSNSAYKRYQEDKKNWGQADYGEVDAAHSAVNTLESTINALRWVLELQP